MLKNKIVHLLEDNRGMCLSGEKIAEMLGVSRTAVWKNIKVLKEEGFEIKTVPGKGYTLSEDSTAISTEGISINLNPDITLKLYESLNSTNTTAMQLIGEGAENKTLVVANTQLKGKGRLGRTFYSPKDTGVYMSLIFKTNMAIDRSVLITSAAAVAAARGIRETTGIESSIKWVNDIYMNEHKVGGILTEAVTDFETGSISHIIVGIGINCSTENFNEFDKGLSNKAGAITSDGGADFVNRNALIAAVANNLSELYDDISMGDFSFINEYKSLSCLLGKDINIYRRPTIDMSDVVEGIAIDIDEKGGLVVELSDGTVETLTTGEVSVRLK